MGIESPIDDLRYSGDNEVVFHYPIMQNPHRRELNQLFAPSHADEGLGVPENMMKELTKSVKGDIEEYIRDGKLTLDADLQTLRGTMPTVKYHLLRYWGLINHKARKVEARQHLILARAAMEEFDNAEPVRLRQEAIRGSQTGNNGGGTEGVAQRAEPGARGRLNGLESGNVSVHRGIPINTSVHTSIPNINKDTHKSQDMRQINHWAIERFCDRLDIPLVSPGTFRIDILLSHPVSVIINLLMLFAGNSKRLSTDGDSCHRRIRKRYNDRILVDVFSPSVVGKDIGQSRVKKDVIYIKKRLRKMITHFSEPLLLR